MRNTDLRVVRTKRAIKEAFIKLLQRKQYNKITIQEIAEEAIINRNTFYLHYLDKDDLLDQLSYECLSNLKESMNSSSIDTVADLEYDDFYEIIKKVFEVIEEDFDFYKVILGNESIPYVSTKFTNVIKNHISEGLNKSDSLKTGERKIDQGTIYVEYMAAGFIGVIRFWINNRHKYSIEEVSKIVITIYSRKMLELLKDIKT